MLLLAPLLTSFSFIKCLMPQLYYDTAKNRLGADKCTGMYAREEDIFNALYRQLKDYVNEHYTTNSAYKQKVQEFNDQIADLTQRKTAAWINAMEHYEQYVQGEIIAIHEISKEYPRQKTNQRSPKGGSARKPQQYLAEAGVIT